MRLSKPFLPLLFLFGIALQSCQKELSFENINTTQIPSHSLKTHRAKVETWIRSVPIKGEIKSSTSIVAKTLRLKEQLITRINIGDKGSSLLFISDSKTFHAYGLNTKNLTFDHSGIVEIFDFQTLQKKGLRFSKGKLFSIVEYDSEKTLNAYLNEYPLTGLRQESSFAPKSRISSEPGNIIKTARKFFCELFGGYWQDSPAENGSTNGSCYILPNGEEQTIDHIASEDWGASNWGLLFQNINNDAFFYNNSQLWTNINVSGSYEPGGTGINTGMIDPDCSDPERIKSLLFILNTKYNQQPPGMGDLSLDDTFEQFKLYKNNQQVFIPIIPWLIKAGANGAADALMQALFIYLTQDDCPSFGAAFGNDLFNKTQVARSALEGLIPWRTPGGKLGRAAFTAIGDVMVNLIDGRYGQNNYELLGQDFMVGFFGDLAGGAAGELASKYALPKTGKGFSTNLEFTIKL